MKSIQEIESLYHLTLHQYKFGYYIKAFPLDYEKFLSLQNDLTELVLEDKKLVFLILCNHKTLVTNGRGDRQNQELNLKSEIPESVEYHEINRGGGITFHGPNQLIFYPILKLGPESFPLTKHLDHMMKLISDVLDEYDVKTTNKLNPLGVWHKDQPIKIASLGVGIHKWVTQHGAAINIEPITISESEFTSLNPCGLNASTYGFAKMFNDKMSLDDFVLGFEEKIKEAKKWPY